MRPNTETERLHNQLVWLRRSVVVMGGLFAFVLFGGLADESDATDLKGRSLTLTTDDGRVWLTAKPLESGGELRLLTTEPNSGIQLSAETKQTLVGVSRTSLFPQVVLGLSADGEPQLLMSRRAADPTASVWLGEHPDKHGCVFFFDEQGNVIGRIPANAKWPMANPQGGEEENGNK